MTDITNIILMVYFTILGLICGSYINALEYRTFNNLSIKGRSGCPKCGNQLKWYHNIPLFSYIFLKGKCAFCKDKISIQYPIVELITSLLFLFGYMVNSSDNTFGVVVFNSYYVFSGLFGMTALWFLLLSVSYISLYDFKHMEIPTNAYFYLSIPSIYLIITSLYNDLSINMVGNIVFYALVWGLFLIGVDFIFKFYFKIKQKMGFYPKDLELPDTIGGGDIKMSLFLGIIVGLTGGHIFLAIIMSYFIGTLLIIPIMLLFKTNKTEGGVIEMPFGPMMLISSILTILYGDKIIGLLGIIGLV